MTDGGGFDLACDSFLQKHGVILYHDVSGDAEPERKKKAASKTKYTCPGCGLNAWAKPKASLICGDCEEELEAEEIDEDDE